VQHGVKQWAGALQSGWRPPSLCSIATRSGFVDCWTLCTYHYDLQRHKSRHSRVATRRQLLWAQSHTNTFTFSLPTVRCSVSHTKRTQYHTARDRSPLYVYSKCLQVKCSSLITHCHAIDHMRVHSHFNATLHQTIH